MRTFEAICLIEQRLARVVLITDAGERLEPHEVCGVIDRECEEWEKVRAAFQAGSLTPQEYHDKCVAVIDTFEKVHFLNRVDRKFNQINDRKAV